MLQNYQSTAKSGKTRKWKAETKLTVLWEVHSSKDYRPGKLALHLALEVDENRGQVVVWIVGDASRGDATNELRCRVLHGKSVKMLVDQRTKRDSEEPEEGIIRLLEEGGQGLNSCRQSVLAMIIERFWHLSMPLAYQHPNSICW